MTNEAEDKLLKVMNTMADNQTELIKRQKVLTEIIDGLVQTIDRHENTISYLKRGLNSQGKII